ncbi:uncharacterized protein LOC123529589 [Mercenaria mercenaria]|uniref:uncharacterized protein LOC123529589 n=1 Tax=Mercenaria mercenaria TaxID=6596 RepID=UPI00234EF609|nr:uncharacterized protein LOC123529589 [Mercenaria mercenaria]XP_053377248.1 uncharacterized protein LOC123529589 [Mercenaria mercenaria]
MASNSSEKDDLSEGERVSSDNSDSPSFTPSDKHRGRKSSHKAKKKQKRHSKYKELSQRFDRLEALVEKALTPKTAEEINSRAQEKNDTGAGAITGNEDVLSIHANSHVGGFSDSDNEDLSSNTKKCLAEIFGEDAVVGKKPHKEGLVLDESQIEIVQNSFRKEEPNFLTAFSEETFEQFPLDENCESFLKVPSLDSLVECCLTKRYGNKASFAKKKEKTLFNQPCKMVDKIGYKGQQAARMGMVINMYVQQSLGNLLQYIESEDFEKSQAVQQVKDIYAMSARLLDQVGRTGAFHHISRRAVAMTDTGLYEQHDSLEFSNLPLTGDGVFGVELEALLKSRKEKKKQVDDLIPDVQKKDLKRKFSGTQTEYNKRPAFDSRQNDSRPATLSSSSNWNNFRIPRITRDSRQDTKGYTNKPRGSFQQRRGSVGRGRLGKPAEK